MNVKVSKLGNLSGSERNRIDELAEENYGSKKWLKTPSNPQEVAYFKESGEIQGFQLFTTSVSPNSLDKYKYHHISDKVSERSTILHHLIVSEEYQGEGRGRSLVNAVESENSQLNLAKGWIPSGSKFLENIGYHAVTEEKQLWDHINFTCGRCKNSPCSCKGIIYSSKSI